MKNTVKLLNVGRLAAFKAIYRQKTCHFLVYLILWFQRKVGILVILVKDFYEL